MSRINSGYCLAQCGYLSKATELLFAAVDSDWDILIMYNLSILHLVRKDPCLISSLIYLKLVIDGLQNTKAAFWLNLTDIRQGCVQVLEQIKQQAYHYDQDTVDQCTSSFVFHMSKGVNKRGMHYKMEQHIKDITHHAL